MYEEEIHFWKLLLKQSETVLARWTPLTFDPVTPRSIGFICYPGRICGPSLRMVGQGDQVFFIGNSFSTFDPVTLTFDPKMKYEEGRSRHSQVIDQKRKGYRQTYRPTDMCKAICPLFFEGGINIKLSACATLHIVNIHVLH